MSDLELTYQIYRYAYFIIIILAVIAGICDLVRKSHKDEIAFQYKQLLKKYNADKVGFVGYETGIDGIPENKPACVFIDKDKMGFQLQNCDYEKIILLDFDQIIWIAGVMPDETIDIDINLPTTEFIRVIIFYKSRLSRKRRYMVFDSNIPTGFCKDINDYMLKLTKYTILGHMQVRFPKCPDNLIHSKHKYNSEVMEL